MGRRFSKFSKKYSLFLSEASNEEIVSISKELTDEIAVQVRAVNIAALAILSVSVIALLVVVLILCIVDGPVTSFNRILVFVRFGSLAMLCIGSILSASALRRALRALSASPLMWRHVRETATDEAVYEQTLAINRLNKLLFTSRNLLSSATSVIVFGVILMAATYAVELLASMGYI